MSCGSIQLIDSSVRIISPKVLSKEIINRLLGTHSIEIQEVVCGDEFQIFHFNSKDDAQKCANFLKQHILFEEKSTEVNLEPDCTGDMVSKSSQNDSGKMKKVIKNLVRINKKKCSYKNEMTSSSQQNNTKTYGNQFLPDCSSPVLLSTADAGFRLAYCYDASALKLKENSQKMSIFNQSIKKYMDSIPKSGSQELVLTNLPSNFKKEDIYQLCGKIEPAEVEIATSNNINVLYANVKAKSKEDFDKLREVLYNCHVDGKKINIIPITKITQTTNQSSP